MLCCVLDVLKLDKLENKPTKRKEVEVCDCNLIRFTDQKPDFLIIEANIARDSGCPIFIGNGFAEFDCDNDRTIEIKRELENVFG